MAAVDSPATDVADAVEVVIDVDIHVRALARGAPPGRAAATDHDVGIGGGGGAEGALTRRGVAGQQGLLSRRAPLLDVVTIGGQWTVPDGPRHQLELAGPAAVALPRRAAT